MRIDLPNSNEFKKILCDLTKKTIDYRINGISTDSRTIVPNNLFIPLRGDKYDGHDYIDKAIEYGAAAII